MRGRLVFRLVARASAPIMGNVPEILFGQLLCVQTQTGAPGPDEPEFSPLQCSHLTSMKYVRQASVYSGLTQGSVTEYQQEAWYKLVEAHKDPMPVSKSQHQGKVLMVTPRHSISILIPLIIVTRTKRSREQSTSRS